MEQLDGQGRRGRTADDCRQTPDGGRQLKVAREHQDALQQVPQHLLSYAPSIEEVRFTVLESFPDCSQIWPATEACMAIVASLLLEGLPVCPALNLVGQPSSIKTTVLSFLDVEGVTYHSDHFTPKSFVSHYATANAKDLPNIDLLPRIRHKCLVIPELAPLFGVRKEDLLENIATLVRVLDGRGLTTDSGTRGRRGYEGDYRFAWLGATTPLPNHVWKVLGKLGSRWVFMNVEDDGVGEEQLVDMMVDNEGYHRKVETCRLWVSSFLYNLWQQNGGFGGTTWANSSDPRELLGIIARLGQLVTRLRGNVSVWEAGGEYDHTPATKEGPRRITQLLVTIARGYELLYGRSQLEQGGIGLVTKIGLSSMPDDRRKVFKALLETGEIDTTAVAEQLSCSRHTALKVMETLVALGAADRSETEVGCSSFDAQKMPCKIQLTAQDMWLKHRMQETDGVWSTSSDVLVVQSR